MSCVVRISVTPRSRSSRSRSHTNRRAAGSSPVVGSSRNSTSGSCISARAIITRWACPPENMSGLTFAALEQPELLEQLVGARARARAAETPW